MEGRYLSINKRDLSSDVSVWMCLKMEHTPDLMTRLMEKMTDTPNFPSNPSRGLNKQTWAG